VDAFLSGQKTSTIKYQTVKEGARAAIKMGEIIRNPSKEDKVPLLEVAVEIDCGRIEPDLQFLYLQEYDEKSKETLILREDRMYKVEKLALVQNLGRCLIRIDFDRSKKYKCLYIRACGQSLIPRKR